VTDFARNKKALHDFAIEETYESGIQLTGPEVKSVREGRANLKESYARVRDGEVFLIGAHISPYANARQERQYPTRDRKLLLHRKEIDRLIGKSQEEGKTLIPLKLYSKNGIVKLQIAVASRKLQIAVASRKRQYDKRREIAKKTADREIERAMKERVRR
jgi:SsrA-binding protein